jgi:hypothetical protein
LEQLLVTLGMHMNVVAAAAARGAFISTHSNGVIQQHTRFNHSPLCATVCAVLQVIVADTFTNLSTQYLGPEALPSQRPFVLLLTGLLVLLMCFPRNLQALGETCTANTAGPSKQMHQPALLGVQAVLPLVALA